MELPPPAPDGQTWLTTAQAAELLGVSKSRITHLRYQGLLTPLDGSSPRKPFYLLDDLVEIEYESRGTRYKRVTHPGRTKPSTLPSCANHKPAPSAASPTTAGPAPTGTDS